MVARAFTAPHVTEWLTVDVTATMKLVERLRARPRVRRRQGLARCCSSPRRCCVAARRNPEINATWDEAAQEIVVKHYVNLGIAAATPRGLVVPNIKDADALSLPRAGRRPRRADRHGARGPDPAGRHGRRHDHDHQRRRLRRRRRHADPQPGRVRDPGVRRRSGSMPWVHERRGRAAQGHARSRCPSTTGWSTASSARCSSPTSAPCSRTRSACSPGAEPRDTHGPAPSGRGRARARFAGRKRPRGLVASSPHGSSGFVALSARWLLSLCERGGGARRSRGRPEFGFRGAFPAEVEGGLARPLPFVPAGKVEKGPSDIPRSTCLTFPGFACQLPRRESGARASGWSRPAAGTPYRPPLGGNGKPLFVSVDQALWCVSAARARLRDNAREIVTGFTLDTFYGFYEWLVKHL